MKSIQEAKDPDLRASAAAMNRAAEAARKTAIQTDTNLIVMKDGKLTRISARALRETAPFSAHSQSEARAGKAMPTGG